MRGLSSLFFLAGACDEGPVIAGEANTNDHFGSALSAGDFDGDGASDLAIGVPDEDGYDNIFDQGTVNVLYGVSVSGLSTEGNESWDQNGRTPPGLAIDDILDKPAAGEGFGHSVATGDFNGDGADDLAVGAPHQEANQGAVNIIYGESGVGLATPENQLWNTETAGLTDIVGDETLYFGAIVGTGDYDGDGFDDLVVGMSVDFGITVLYGGPSGLTTSGIQVWTAQAMLLDDGRYGFSLTSGDFDADGFDDLAVGRETPTLAAEDIPAAVAILYGAGAGGLTTDRIQVFTLAGVDPSSASQSDVDYFGAELAAGDFDADGVDDLAIGAQGWGDASGMVLVLYGRGSSPTAPPGLSAEDHQTWTQSTVGLGASEPGHIFGAALAAGNFNSDGFADLAIGAPFDDLAFDGPAVYHAGSVSVLYGADLGLSNAESQRWSASSDGVMGAAKVQASFGAVLSAGDFDGDDRDDLAIGAPLEDVGEETHAGAVHVLYSALSLGDAGGLSAQNDQLWNQDE